MVEERDLKYTAFQMALIFLCGFLGGVLTGFILIAIISSGGIYG